MLPVEPPVKPTSTDTAPPAQKPSLIERFKSLFLQYGPLAILIHYVIFGLTVGGFFVAMKLGFQVESAGGTAGSLAAAYAASQVVKPLRLAAVLALTPIIGRIPVVSRFLQRFWVKSG